MKKYLSVLSVVFLLLFICNGMVNGQEIDPTGKLDEIIKIDNQSNEDVLSLMKDIRYDYHPIYGEVGLRDMPVYAAGWSEKIVPELFSGYKILKYQVLEEEITGTALVEHKAEDGTIFYVWHKVENEPSIYVLATVETIASGKEGIDKPMALINPIHLQVGIRIIKWCGNGYVQIEVFGVRVWVKWRWWR